MWGRVVHHRHPDTVAGIRQAVTGSLGGGPPRSENEAIAEMGPAEVERMTLAE